MRFTRRIWVPTSEKYSHKLPVVTSRQAGTRKQDFFDLALDL